MPRVAKSKAGQSKASAVTHMVGERQATGYLERFADALEILCTERPPLELCELWLRHVEPQGVLLQDWAINHTRANWGTGIGVLEAAEVLAETPEEGMDHEGYRADFRPEAEPVADHAETARPQVDPADARFILATDDEEEGERGRFFYCRDEEDVERRLAALLFGATPTAGDRVTARQLVVTLFMEGIANTEGGLDVYLHRLAAAPARSTGEAEPLEVGRALQRWIADHKAELNAVEFARIDASLERLMMHIALADAHTTVAKTAAPLYRFLQPGDRIRATDEYLLDDFRKWEQVDPAHAAGLAGSHDVYAVIGSSIFRGAPYMPGMKPVRRAVGRPAADDEYEDDDAIARSRRILALVDTYHERPTADTRTELRKALMNEFTSLLAAATQNKR
jgi:hypothetical protein